MEPLDLFPFLSDIKSDLDYFYSLIISQKNISLIAEPKLDQIIALSLLESSFLDKGISYRRIFLDDVNEYVRIDDGLCLFFSEPVGNDTTSFLNKSREISIKMGQHGTLRNGVIDLVTFSGCLGLMIGNERVNKLIPFLLSGNWLKSNLDYTYDPIFTALRDNLEDHGLISVNSIVEINNIDIFDLPGIDIMKLKNLKKEWNKIELSEQSEKLSEIVLPLLNSSLGVARLEELIWHRVICSGWDYDLASQCSRVQRDLRTSENKLIFSSRLVDNIIKTSKLC
jgi:hypothetical protein